MAIEFVMPRMGLTMEEGTIVKWHKRVGEPVKKGEPLLEIETDKVTAEVEANADGLLGAILVAEGVTVPIGAPIAYIIAPGEALPESAPAAPAARQAAEASPAAAPTQVKGLDTPDTDVRKRASPAARRAARELGVDLGIVAGRGPRGRILETDVRRVTPVAARMAADLGIDLGQVQGSGPRGLIRKSDLAAPAAQPASELLEISSAHKLMAERMTYSFSTAPHFYLAVEVDAAELVALRQKLLPRIETSQGVRLTYTDLLAFFLVKALAEHPLVNAAWEGGGIRLNAAVNLGIAIDSPRGLVAPVVRGAERLSLGEIAQARAALTEKARTGKLELDDLAGGTFTLSNLGIFRVDSFNAVLNPPQAAILAVGRIHDKVVPYQGQPTIRPAVGMTLTCDHRVIDGAGAARFLTRLVELIEEPYSFFV